MGPDGIAADLNWYWIWSEGEMSPPSNYSAMVSAISLGPRPASYPSTEMDEGRLKAATHARLISRTLENVSNEDRRVLFGAFGPFARKLPVLGESAPIAALTRTAAAAHRASNTSRSFGDWLVRLCWRVSKHQGDKPIEDSATLHSIAGEARRVLEGALAAYHKAESKRRGLAVQKRLEPSQVRIAAAGEGQNRQEAGDTEI
jgi:hypothetical protein